MVYDDDGFLSFFFLPFFKEMDGKYPDGGRVRLFFFFFLNFLHPFHSCCGACGKQASMHANFHKGHGH